MKDENKTKSELIHELNSLREKTTKIENLLFESENMVKIGSWEWDVKNDVLSLSEGWKHIHGVEKNDISMEELLPIAHPDDIPAVKKAIKDAFDNSKPYEIVHRIIRQDNREVRYIKAHGKVIHVNGKPVKMYGTSQDITESKNTNEKLHLMKNAVESSINAIAVANLNGYLTYVNSTCLKMWGYESDDEVLGKHVAEFFQDKEKASKIIQSLYKNGNWVGEGSAKTKDGTVLNIYGLVNLVNDESGTPVAIMGSFVDITEKREFETKLKESEQKFHSYIDNSPVGIFVVQKDGHYVDVNPAATRITGYSRAELLSMQILDLVPNDSHDQAYRVFNELLKTGKSSIEVPYITKSGAKRYWIIDAVKITDDQYIGFTTDITKRKEAEERVKEQTKQIIDSERTRELELHHRIKNNLQVISSLLSLQSGKFEDDEVNDAFKDTQNRVISMSLVHQKLYQTNGLDKINSRDYIKDLINYLTGLYHGKYINLNIEVQDINFGIDTIIPLGMLINELVSNSLKYAFSDDEQGEINIKLYRNDRGIESDDREYYTLIIADNGRGIPEDIDIRDTDSLGLQLINSLVDQINGNFKLDKSNGTKFTINFSG